MRRTKNVRRGLDGIKQLRAATWRARVWDGGRRKARALDEPRRRRRRQPPHARIHASIEDDGRKRARAT